jgi:hypothetical protein
MCYRKAFTNRPWRTLIDFTAGTRPSASRFSVAACVAVLATVAGCGDNASAPSGPSDTYQGSWSGTIDDSAGGMGTLRISLSGGAPLTGIWSAILPVASPTGFVTSEPATSARRSLALACGAAGSVGLDAVVSGKTMTGTYLALGCGLSSGSIKLVRP